MKLNPLTAAIVSAASVLGFATAANIVSAASGNGSTVITPCDANGVCSAGAAGTYTVARGAGNTVVLTDTTGLSAEFRCVVFPNTPTQTRIECTKPGMKVIAQATVQKNVLNSKVVTR
jgi:MaoC like domain